LDNVCRGQRLVLVGTVNMGREAVVTAALVGADTQVVCRWPATRANSCSEVPPTGATVAEEVGIYTVSDR
jgi:hypothetical protein